MKMSLGNLGMSMLGVGGTIALLGGNASEVLVGQAIWLACFFVGASIIDVIVERCEQRWRG